MGDLGSTYLSTLRSFFDLICGAESMGQLRIRRGLGGARRGALTRRHTDAAQLDSSVVNLRVQHPASRLLDLQQSTRGHHIILPSPSHATPITDPSRVKELRRSTGSMLSTVSNNWSSSSSGRRLQTSRRAARCE